MFVVHQPVTFRARVKEQLTALSSENPTGQLTPDKLAVLGKNLEIGIFNYAVTEATKKQISMQWSNPFFVIIYTERLRTVDYNLATEPDLCKAVLLLQIKAHEIAFMTHQMMAPGKWQPYLDECRLREAQQLAPKLVANTDSYTCRRCKSKECSYYQLQTRSADEAMTTFVVCITCSNRWKC